MIYRLHNFYYNLKIYYPRKFSKLAFNIFKASKIIDNHIIIKIILNKNKIFFLINNFKKLNIFIKNPKIDF